MTLFRKGAALGDPDATYSVAYILLKEEKLLEGLSWLKRAVALGSEHAAELMQKYEEAELAAKRRVEQQQHWRPGQIRPDAQFMIDLFGGMLRGMRLGDPHNGGPWPSLQKQS